PELGDQRGGDPVAIDDLHLLQAEADDVYHKVVGILDGSDRAQYDAGVAGVVRDLLGEQEPGDVDVGDPLAGRVDELPVVGLAVGHHAPRGRERALIEPRKGDVLG